MVIRTLAAAGLLLTVLLGSLALLAGPALADDYYCVVVTDPQGRPVNTTCVPWP